MKPGRWFPATIRFMGNVVGELLPLAVGVAISPLPIIAVILMLLAPRAGGASRGFGAGWVVGILVATFVVVIVASVADIGGTSSDPSTGSSWVKLILGLLLVHLSLSQWRKRPRGDEPAVMPKWMASIDRITPVKAAGLGFLLSAVNPKNLTMCIAAGIVVAGGNLGGGQEVGAVLIFTVIAASTVLIPVIGYAVARERMSGWLTELRTWLEHNNTAVMAVLILVIGVVLLGKGIGGLT
jgi:threonine/homoserine/homoserine lactone efflux protein